MNTIPVVDSDEYLKRLLAAHRPGGEKMLAFYEHRLGVIGTDPRLMLMLWDDHLVHRGDGVFETMKWVDGKLYQLDPHLKRMQCSAGSIFLAPPCSLEEVSGICIQVAKAANRPNGMVRVLLGRGPGGFGIDPLECPLPALYVVAYTFTPKSEEAYAKGVTAFRTSIPAKQSYMATIKSTDYLPNMLMKREAVQKGFDYPICFDEHDFLAEGAVENVCIVDRDGVLRVPAFDNCLAGTTMRRAMELISGERKVDFGKIRESEIYEAREFIVVGTTVDAVSIVRFNGKPIHDARPGPVAKRMRELLKKDLQENGIPVYNA
ncbi:aminotransferase class IV [Desulfovibrio sp. X2]|uniref:aminotransferase class IV n=1 Tax=Desulfovibrio sp. X2 TaxID=941449 RepID=UPI000358EF65|nr:aminotransferase class IV [Desulfovibrio sp. X2]EPR42677.1 aminotransferase class IV [Desulfovibrio sp. X2]